MLDHLAAPQDEAVFAVRLGNKLSNIHAMERDYNALDEAL